MEPYRSKLGITSTPLPELLRGLRLAAKLTQAQLGEQSGVLGDTVWRVEDGDQPAPQGLLDAYGRLARNVEDRLP